MKFSLPLLILTACGGSQATPTTYQQKLVGEEQAKKTLCVTSNASREEADKCIEAVKAEYDAKFKDSGL
jgi:uncharacterized protein YcfL